MTTATKIKCHTHFGTIKGCLFLGACDIGHGILPDGNGVYTTWGRNLDEKGVEWARKMLNSDTVLTGEVWEDGVKRNSYEIVIPQTFIDAWPISKTNQK